MVRICLKIISDLINQVGGHTKILGIGNGLICKPLDSREREFYRRRPQCLSQFMPEYKGEIVK